MQSHAKTAAAVPTKAYVESAQAVRTERNRK